MVGLFLLLSRTETTSPTFTMRGGDVALAAVDVDVAVAHHLARLRAAGAEAHAVDDAVQAALQVLHQVLAGDALLQRGLLEGDAELAFQHAVDAADLLLLAQAAGRSRRSSLCAILAVLSGDEVALLDGALFAVAALALEVTVSCPRAGIAGKRGRYILPSLFSLPFSTQVRFTAMAGLRPAYYHSAYGQAPSGRLRLACNSYTLRFLGGRQPLCGIGVTSLMARTSIPAVRQRANRRFAARTRTADPHFHHTQPAFVGLVGRRHGRLLRGEGSALARPAEAQRTGARPGDRVAFLIGDGHDGVVEGGLHVHDARVDDALFLLLEALLLAWSLLVLSPYAIRYVLPVAFFLFATVPRRGPLRVRALVCVRCPRTGRLRRCRSPR